MDDGVIMIILRNSEFDRKKGRTFFIAAQWKQYIAAKKIAVSKTARAFVEKLWGVAGAIKRRQAIDLFKMGSKVWLTYKWYINIYSNFLRLH